MGVGGYGRNPLFVRARHVQRCVKKCPHFECVMHRFVLALNAGTNTLYTRVYIVSSLRMPGQVGRCVCVCVCVGEGTVVLMVVCVGGSAKEVCMEVTGYGDGCVGVGWVCVFGGVDGLVSEFWTSGIVLYVTTHFLKHKKFSTTWKVNRKTRCSSETITL